MEEKKRGRGRPKGSKNKRPYPYKGKDSHMSKLWDVYHHGKFIGTFKSTREVGKVIDRSPVRCWQMAMGWNGGRKTNAPITSKNGYTVLTHGEPWGWWITE